MKILKEVRFSENLLILKFNLFGVTEAKNIHQVLMSGAQYPASFFLAVKNR